MNSKNYKDLFNKINLSDDVSEDIKTMSFESKTTRKSFKANFATALAVLIGVFVVSNGITYAATGDTLVKKLFDGISKISVHYNSEDIDEYKVDEYVDEQVYNFEISDSETEDETTTEKN